ncbi:MAG: hypothetical protein AAGH68_03685 [Pseudomonadota bacterium]
MPKLNEPFRDNPLDKIWIEQPDIDDPDLPPPPDETPSRASAPKLQEKVLMGEVIPMADEPSREGLGDKTIGEEPDIDDPDLPPPPDETPNRVPTENFSFNYEEIEAPFSGVDSFDFAEIRGSGSEIDDHSGLDVVVAATTTERAKPEWEEIDDYTAEMLPDYVRGDEGEGSMWDGMG